MTNEKLLAKLNRLGNESMTGDARYLLDDLIRAVEDEIRTEAAKSS